MGEKALRAAKQFEQLQLSMKVRATPTPMSRHTSDPKEATQEGLDANTGGMSSRAQAVAAALLESLSVGSASTRCKATTESGSIPEYVAWLVYLFPLAVAVKPCFHASLH